MYGWCGLALNHRRHTPTDGCVIVKGAMGLIWENCSTTGSDITIGWASVCSVSGWWLCGGGSSGPTGFAPIHCSPNGLPRSCSSQILRIFAAQDFLAEIVSDDSFLDQRFTLGPDHEMRHVLRAENGSWVVTSATLRQQGGFEFTGRLDVNVISLLSGCDGSRTLRELLADMARRLNVNFSSVAPMGVEVMRSLMRSGFLTVPDHPSFRIIDKVGF